MGNELRSLPRIRRPEESYGEHPYGAAATVGMCWMVREMIHCLELRVYYEDTDLAGIVYYANYLKFIERARSEFLRELGVDQRRMRIDRGTVFAVRRIEADYLEPARFDDLLRVETYPQSVSGARIVLGQDVRRGGTLLFRSTVTLAMLSESGRPTRIPADLRRAFQARLIAYGTVQ